MSAPLKQRVESRDRLVQQAEQAGARLNAELLAALAGGDVAAATAVAQRQAAALAELAESLRIYQAELHAQADELAHSQARTEELLDRFATLFARMPVAALRLAANGEVVQANALAEQLFGALGHGRVVFLHRLVDDRAFQQTVRPAIAAARVGDHRILADVAFVGAGGRRFVGELHLARLRDTADGRGSYLGVVVDRSVQRAERAQLRLAVEANRQSQEFLAETARLARTGGWALEPGTRLLRWSPQLLALLGLPPAASAHVDTLLALCSDDGRRQWAQALDDAEHRGQPFEFELDLRDAADTARWLRVRVAGRPLYAGDDGGGGGDDGGGDGRHGSGDRSGDAQGSSDGAAAGGPVALIHGLVQDITAQHHVRRQLSDATERLAIATAAGGIGVWEVDLAHGPLRVDARGAQLFGLPAAGVHDAGLAEALAPLLDAGAAAQLRQALDTAAAPPHGLLSLELALARASPPRWVFLSGRARDGDGDGDGSDGRAARLMGCAWDSSLQHETLRLAAARDAAESASQAKSAFLSRMSHELRTPLNAILGFSQLMALEAAAGDLVLKPHRVELIESAARHLLELVGEVLDVSHIDTAALAVRLTRCDLRGVVHESLAMVHGAAATRGVTLHDALAAGPPVWVRGDRVRLKGLVVNLLSNAVKYNVAGGRVDVQARADEAAVELEVSDTGRGMTPAQLEHLFEPFNRLGAEALGIEGTGMGLFVSRRFAELMGGQLRLTSRAGHGTAAVLTMPTAAAPAPDPPVV